MSILIHDELAFVMDEDGHVETEESLDVCPVMSFSDDFEAETLDAEDWKSFPPARFVLPELVLTRSEGEVCAALVVRVEPGATEAAILSELAERAGPAERHVPPWWRRRRGAVAASHPSLSRRWATAQSHTMGRFSMAWLAASGASFVVRGLSDSVAHPCREPGRARATNPLLFECHTVR